MSEEIVTLAPSIEQIERLERIMLAMPQAPIETVHHFADGLYAREIMIPAGCTVTGKVHSGEHLNIVSKGSITVWTDEGMKLVDAPFTMVSKPGTKRVGFAHTDTVWTTIHRNDDNTHDLALLESRLIVLPAIAFEKEQETPCLG